MKKILLAGCFLACFSIQHALAQTVPAGVSPVETLAKQAVVFEAHTQTPLYEKEADAQMPTSSMSKVMTMYLVFEAIKNGKLEMGNLVTVSENAWKQTGSRMFLNVGDQVKVEDLIRGVIVQSGNDAAVALAEAVGGSEASFSVMMNEKAKQLGMTNSHFMNATGLPDPQHYSTARDLAKLAMALIRDYPDFYHYYSETEFTHNKIKQGNRNPLLYRNMGADGVKTGHTEDAGYGLIGSVLRDGRRIVTVVNGLKTMQERADEPAKLIEWAYREFGLFSLISKDTKLGDAPVWLGEAKTVPVLSTETVEMSLPRGAKDKIKTEVTINGETEAPIAKGQVLGKAVISGEGIATREIPLVAAEDVKRLGTFAVWVAKLKRMMGKE